jgi:hypothetical protein
MTEAEWLVCCDPTSMLEFLRGKASERKLRLFAVACCRLVLKKVRVSRQAEREVDLAERYADGAASIGELEDARCYSNSDAEHACMNAAELEGGVVMADCAAGNAAWAAAKHEAEPPDDNSLSPIFNARFAVEQGIQSDLLRDIIGNPFCSLPLLDPARLRWNHDTVWHLAEAAYEARHLPSGHLDSARLAVLADALEEAGCTEADLLDHLRGSGPHVRGCHVLDLLLSRK